MKKILNRVFSLFLVTFFVLTLGFSYFSNRVVDELEQINRLYYENTYLSDAAIVCMQLYALNPSEQNKATCLKIEHTINKNSQEIKSYTIAGIYLSYINKL